MLQLINLGTAPNAGDGDDLRAAFAKLNALIGGFELAGNANGEYLRLPNGFQATWRRVSENPVNGATSHLYPSDLTAFARPFSAPPEVIITAVEPPDPGSLVHARASRYVYRNTITTHGVRVMVLAPEGSTFDGARPLITSIVAVGRYA